MVTDTTPKPVRIDGARQIFGEATEDNDRIYSIEPRHYVREADAHMTVTLRMWGHGHWCIANGARNDRRDAAAAHADGQRWIATGE